MAESASGGGGGRALTPASGIHGSGYLTPDLATRSSSPDSGSFHTANPLDSERSSPAALSDQPDWERQHRDELSSVEIPSLDGDHMTPQISHLEQPSLTRSPDDSDGEEEVTIRNHPSPPRSMGHSRREGGGARNWINQPKLIPADSETVPPCPEKRPLQDNGVRPPSNHGDEETVRETTPLLPPAPHHQSSQGDRDCCVLF